mmetsp:Transcript_5460/g.11605  ORF Transcript_5460/g.11605 Transcript_5460/m.11605 type:complete len:240 (-) Transcript_5460:6-725(-)
MRRISAVVTAALAARHSTSAFVPQAPNNPGTRTRSGCSTRVVQNGHRSAPTVLRAFDTAIVSDAISHSSINLAEGLLSNDNIKEAFNLATFGPQLPWLFIILFPNAEVTKKLFGDLKVVIFFALVHFFIVSASIAQPDGTAPMAEFADVFDPAGNPQGAMMGMMQYPNFVTEEWSHVLTWDLFVGRYVWLDGLRRGVFTSHSVLFCNLIGPPGLLMHLATCLVTGKGLPGNEVEDIAET